ncbi:MAG: YihY/virulence factor BrkB family protein [Bdellovibrionales bacterium]|nr:YihY/virulence factor BrkB family protein [Bdellovibrionales bacterium]
MMRKLSFIIHQFSEDEIFTRSSSLAYYTALAMAPLVILFVWLLSLMNLNLQQEMVQEVARLIGSDGATLVQAIIQGANDRPDLSSVSGWVGLIWLLVSASVIFVQLQDTLDTIFDFKKDIAQNETTVAFVKRTVVDRLFSMGMLLTFVFMSIVSLILSSVISFFVINSEVEALMHLISTLINLTIFTFLFAIIFKWMPSQRISFKSSLIGGAITSALFIIGKTAVGIYLGTAGLGSAYGAAGSLIVLLAWVFYSSLIFFLGAEISYAFIIRAEKGADVDAKKDSTQSKAKIK